MASIKIVKKITKRVKKGAAKTKTCPYCNGSGKC